MTRRNSLIYYSVLIFLPLLHLYHPYFTSLSLALELTQTPGICVKIQYFRCSQGGFYAKKYLSVLNISSVPQKQRCAVGASYSVQICYLKPAKFIADMFSNKDKRDVLVEIIITRREVIIFTSREQLYIFMKHFGIL